MRRVLPRVTILIILSLFFSKVVFGQDISGGDRLLPGTPGYAVLAGDVRIELFISPPILAPGKSSTFQFVVTNNSDAIAAPQLLIPTPPNMNRDTGILRAGTSFNAVDNSYSWQPVVQPGEQQVLSLNFIAGEINESNPVYQYVVNAINGEIQEFLTTTFWIGDLPQATILPDRFQASVGQSIQLQAEATGSGPYLQIWELGDGRRLEANDPTVVFGDAGIYNITLHIVNPLGATEANIQVEILDHPTAAFIMSDPSPAVGQEIQFINESGGQLPLTYLWDFGDGMISNEESPSYKYDAAGEYIVSLTVNGQAGQNAFVWPFVVGQGPQIQIINLPETVFVGDPILLQANGDSSVTSFVWDTGDGNLRNGQQIEHSYLASREYYIWLTASNDFETVQVGQWLTVIDNESQAIFHTYLPLVVQRVSLKTTEIIAGTHEIETTLIEIEPAPTIETFETLTLEQSPLPTTATEAEQLLWYVNEARRLHNLPPLQYAHNLSVAAQRHAEDMAINQFTSHTGSDGSKPFERFATQGYNNTYAGEATAWGFPEAISAVEFWVNSSGHRHIILNPKAVEVGVGYKVDFEAPNVWYWVTEYGEPPAEPTEE